MPGATPQMMPVDLAENLVNAARPKAATRVASKRILFIDHTARMGGGEIALQNLVCSLEPQLFTPLVLLFADGPLRQRLEALGIVTRVLLLDADIGDVRKESLGGRSLGRAGLLLRTAAFAWRTRRAIRQLNPALVHTNSLKSDLIGGVAARLAGVPLVWHVRDRIAEDYLPKRVTHAFRWLARWLPTAVVANSAATMSTLQAETTRTKPSGRFSVIHDGIPLSRVAVEPTANRGGPTVVGLVGRLTRWKGQHIFIEAIRLVHSRFPDARFQIIGAPLFGEEGYEEELRELVARHDLEPVVEFTGFRADIEAAIAALDVVVHASITGEPFGQVIVEAMAAFKPVVATDGGGVPEIVVHGETGLLVPMGDVAAMADSIALLLADPALRREMGYRGRARVVDRFTIQHTAARVQALYDRLLGR